MAFTQTRQVQTRQGAAGLIYFAVAFSLGAYFTFAAVQGDYGVFRRVEIVAEAEALAAERNKLAAELAEMVNLTRRLSDAYLDLDLLDQQARDILGYVRPDEIVIR
jgi:cell division protein FtsB